MWTLLLARAGDPPGAYVDRRQIDGGQIKIGRAIDKCDWVLADDHGHLSREHCTIIANGLDLFVLDTSSNGTALNDPGQFVPPHQPVAIRVSDRLFVGDFVIEVATESAGSGAMVAPPPPPLPAARSSLGQPDEWFQAAADPIWENGPRNAEVHDFLNDSFHDFLGPPAAPPRAMTGEAFNAAGMGLAFSKPIMAPMTSAAGDFGIPEDWASAGAAPLAPPKASPPGFLGEAAFPPLPPAGPGFGGDPFADFGPLPASGGHALPADDPFADLPPLQEAHPLADFLPLAPAPAAAPPAARPAMREGAAPDGDWAAFCEGAGIDTADLRVTADGMRRLGVLYRQVVLGLSDLIQERAEFKDEFRVERTQLGIGRNNPLKHLPPLDSAKILLGEPLPGFMPADEAVRTAFEDIKKHQMAMLAGVQHALTAVFKRLAPAEIERLLQKASGERRGLQLLRGVDAWTVYQTVFDALRVDATSNANSVMSVAFREGYEAFLKSGPGRPQ